MFGKRLFFLAFLLVVWACSPEPAKHDPLPSWNPGVVKEKIIAFVEEVTDSHSNAFVPQEFRIATFDQDGTLLLEKPFFLQLNFAAERAIEMAKKNPVLAREQPFKALLENDREYLSQLSRGELSRLLTISHSEITEKEFQATVENFLQTFRDPKFDLSVSQMVYRPTLELLLYLQSKGFKTYICTGGGMDFTRVYSAQAYSVPSEHVIGTASLTRFEIKDGAPYLMRLPEVVPPINVRAGKPVNTERYIGKRPILAIGNSDGDIEMLEFATTPDRGPVLAMLIHHDDEEREYAYNKGTEEALEIAKTKGWLIVSMKQNFKAIFNK